MKLKLVMARIIANVSRVKIITVKMDIIGSDVDLVKKVLVKPVHQDFGALTAKRQLVYPIQHLKKDLLHLAIAFAKMDSSESLGRIAPSALKIVGVRMA